MIRSLFPPHLIAAFIVLSLLVCTGGRHPEWRHFLYAGSFLLSGLFFLRAAISPQSLRHTAVAVPLTAAATPLWGYLVWHGLRVSAIPTLTLEYGIGLLAFTVFADFCWLARPGQKPGRNGVVLLVIIICLFAIIGLAAHLNHTPFPTLAPRLLHMPDRATGSFDNANHFASWLNIGAMGALALLCSHRNPWELRVLLALAWVCITTALVFTLSRSAHAAFLIGLILFGGYHALRGANKKLRPVAALLTLASVGILVFVSFGSSAMRERWNATGKDLRGGFWENAWSMIQQAPLFGHGGGTYAYTGRPTSTYWFTDVFVNHAHNEVLNTVAEIGWVGLGLSLFLIGPLLLRTLLGSRKPDRPRPDTYRILPLVLGVVILGQSTVDLNLRVPVIGFTAVYMASLLGRQRRANKLPPLFRMALIGLVLASTAGAWGAYRIGNSYRHVRLADEAAARFKLFEAKKHYLLAQRAVPHDWRPTQALAEWHLRFGLMQHGSSRSKTLADAFRLSDQALVANPLDTRTVLIRADILRAQGHLAEARSLLEEQRRIDKRNFAIHRLLAEVYIDQKDWEKAYWILGKFTERESGYAEARERLIMVRERVRILRGLPPSPPAPTP